MNRVYWIKGRSQNVYRNITSKVEALLSLDEMAETVEPDRTLAIKVNIGELGHGHNIPPIIITSFFEQARAKGTKAVVTDSGSLFKGPRFDGHGWSNTAIVQGFGIGDAFDNQLMLTGGFTNEEGRFTACDGEHLGGVEISSMILDVSNLVVLSHVTAHPLLGIAGAIYNLGLGTLTRSGKARVHSCLELEFDESRCDGSKACLPYCPTGAIADSGEKISFDARICNGCLGCFMSCPNGAMGIKPEGIPVFQESAVEAAKVVRDNLRGKAFFVNFLSSVTPQSDDYPFSDVPFIPDLGILASADPVALDLVTYQMIVRSPGVPGSIADELNILEKGTDKVAAITGLTPEPMLEYAENIKLGSRECEFLISA